MRFESFRHENWEIYVMNAEGSGVMRLMDHPDEDRYSAWSRE